MISDGVPFLSLLLKRSRAAQKQSGIPSALSSLREKVDGGETGKKEIEDLAGITSRFIHEVVLARNRTSDERTALPGGRTEGNERTGMPLIIRNCAIARINWMAPV